MKEIVLNAIEGGVQARNDLRKDVDKIVQASVILVEAFRSGNKVLAAGNGGSASDAQHFTAEFEGKYSLERPGLSAICLNTNGSTITAWANDFSFDTIFERQIEAHGKPGDVFVAISTGGGSFQEGYSRNIALAAQKAKAMGMKVIGLAGKTGGVLKEISDVCVVVNSNVTARIQECHIAVLHMMAELVDEQMFSPRASQQKEAVR